MEGIKNIIFDLGGVIINLDMTLTMKAFQQLAGKEDVPLYTYETQHSLFKQYEIGALSSVEFRDGIRQALELDITDEAIDKAWNAMLLDIPPKRLELLTNLKTKYRTFLLSNTNEIHYNAFTEIIKTNHQQPGLEPYFEEVYYSHQLGKRKPNADIFEQVLNENNLIPAETLFLDDTAGHLEGAQQLGIKTMLVTPDNGILHIFKEYC